MVQFKVEYNIQGRKKNLENIKEVVVKFKKRMNIKVRRQMKLDIVKEEILEEESYQRSI